MANSKTLAAHRQARLPIPKDFASHRDVLAFYDNRYYSLIEAGDAVPFTYPFAAVGALFVLAALLVDYRRSRARRLGSYVAFGVMCCFQVWTIATNRARNPAASFGVGLVSAFGIMWTAAIMIFNDCQRDFRRIERAEDRALAGGGKVQGNGHADKGLANGSAEVSGGENAVRQRRATKEVVETATKGPTQRQGPLIWQAYPEGPMIERLDWIADVFCSFRGVGWTWQSSGIPKPPTWVEAQLSGDTEAIEKAEDVKVSRTGIRRFSDRRALLKACLINLAIGYVVLDAIKTLGIHDKYMWYGDMSLPPPDFLPDLIKNSFVLTKYYRLLVCLCAINLALWAIFKMGPVFFVGILGPKFVGVRGEAWVNPADMFGDFTHVLDSGLAGWWGAWWHQTFRFAFQQPGDFLVRSLGLKPRSVGGKLVSTWVAFFLSGVLHASGSYTQLGDTRPITGPLAFFLSQALGVTVQTALVQVLKLDRIFPKSVRQAANLVIVAVWMYFTAPLLVDDFARGGIWLFEPVPFSIFRGLGLGPEGERCWCWYGRIVEWRSGMSWWDTGIAL
ncbi:hypothetical protein WHR41_00518 [Cladosporium halotolerans]|uniref:Wax synthase domain-containing protein n=1 Tax=Cladosporium halotolerans TaxID=1052096 RepID=A0AB34KZP3_9PEZI